jgi:hypothetical protein
MGAWHPIKTPWGGVGAFDRPRPMGWDPDGWGQVGENPPRGTPVRSLVRAVEIVFVKEKPSSSPRES